MNDSADTVRDGDVAGGDGRRSPAAATGGGGAEDAARTAIARPAPAGGPAAARAARLTRHPECTSYG